MEGLGVGLGFEVSSSGFRVYLTVGLWHLPGYVQSFPKVWVPF